MIGRYYFLVVLVIASACSSKNVDGLQSSTQMSDTLQNNDFSSVNDSTNNLSEESLDYDKAFRIESYIVAQPDKPSEITVIRQNSAVYTYPDDQTIEAMKKKYKDDFYTIADDVNWYRFESSQLLDSLKISQLTVTTRYLEFSQLGKRIFIDTQAFGSDWRLFFLHTQKDPKIVSMVGLSVDSVLAYFDVPLKP